MADGGAKVRSPSQEAALDAKIEAIRKRNQEIEERQKIVQKEAKEVKAIKGKGGNSPSASSAPNGTPSLENGDAAAGGNGEQKDEKKPQEANGKPNGRSWDKGKSPIDQWKTNVPELGDKSGVRSNPPFNRGGRRGRGRGGRSGGNSNGERGGFFHDVRQREEPNGEGTEAPKEADSSAPSKRPQRGQRPPAGRGGDRGGRPRPATDENREPKGPVGDQKAEDGRRAKGGPRASNPKRSPKAEGDEQKSGTGKTSAQKRPFRNRNERRASDPPDQIQIKQLLNALIRQVANEEQREKHGLPKEEKESEV